MQDVGLFDSQIRACALQLPLQPGQPPQHGAHQACIVRAPGGAPGAACGGPAALACVLLAAMLGQLGRRRRVGREVPQNPAVHVLAREATRKRRRERRLSLYAGARACRSAWCVPCRGSKGDHNGAHRVHIVRRGSRCAMSATAATATAAAAGRRRARRRVQPPAGGRMVRGSFAGGTREVSCGSACGSQRRRASAVCRCMRRRAHRRRASASIKIFASGNAKDCQRTAYRSVLATVLGAQEPACCLVRVRDAMLSTPCLLSIPQNLRSLA